MRLSRLAVALLVLAAVAALAAVPAPAAAQSPEHARDALTPGRRALSFALPHGGGSEFGVWKVVAPGRSRGFFLSAHAVLFTQGDTLEGTTHNASLSLAAGPSRRRYLDTSGPVTPFVETGVRLLGAYSRSSAEYYGGRAVTSAWSAGAGASAAIGAEWFPLHRLSVQANTGLRPSLVYRRDTFGDRHYSGWTADLATFVSGFSVQVYF